MISNLILKIKRQENVFCSFLYRAAKGLYSCSFPSIKPIHLPLYYFHCILAETIKKLCHAIWTVPLFKARCEKVGKSLRLPNGMPFVIGSHLKIIIGDNVTIAKSTIGANKIFDDPIFSIGDNSSIGYGTSISVAKEVTIGKDTLISVNCLIMDSDDHPINPSKRLLKQQVDPENINPVIIGNNVWIGACTAILKGVTIGNNSIVGTHSVVTQNIPANCICAGVPAKIIKYI